MTAFIIAVFCGHKSADSNRQIHPLDLGLLLEICGLIVMLSALISKIAAMEFTVSSMAGAVSHHSSGHCSSDFVLPTSNIGMVLIVNSMLIMNYKCVRIEKI